MERSAKALFGIAALFACIAIPAHADTIDLNIDNSLTTPGTFTSSGGSFYIDQLQVGGTMVNIPTGTSSCPDCLLLTYSAGSNTTLTITNGSTSDFASVGAGATLYSATGVSSSGTSTNNTLNLTFSDPTMFALDPNFFNDLVTDGLVSASLPNEFSISGGVIGSQMLSNNLITSDTVTLTQAPPTIPEPSSLLLLATGMVAAAGVARKYQFTN